MNKFLIWFYETPDGLEPAKDFILNQDKKMKAKILKVLDMLRKNGNELGEPYTKFLEDGIFEIRIRQSNNSSRILYFFEFNRQIILTNGFTKKTQKTPKKEIKKAKKYRDEYERRKYND